MGSEEDRLAQRVTELEAKVEDLTAAFHQFRLSVRASGTASAGYTVVSSAASEAAASGVSSSYNDLATEIPAVPDFCIRNCSVLTGGKFSSRDRAARAWESGWWARFVLEGRVAKPRPSTPIDVPNQFYIILRAEGHSCPILCNKAADYRYIVGDFTNPTLSHGFPSQAEAKIYCLGAGVSYPSGITTWSQLQ